MYSCSLMQCWCRIFTSRCARCHLTHSLLLRIVLNGYPADCCGCFLPKTSLFPTHTLNLYLKNCCCDHERNFIQGMCLMNILSTHTNTAPGSFLAKCGQRCRSRMIVLCVYIWGCLLIKLKWKKFVAVRTKH